MELTWLIALMVPFLFLSDTSLPAEQSGHSGGNYPDYVEISAAFIHEEVRIVSNVTPLRRG